MSDLVPGTRYGHGPDDVQFSSLENCHNVYVGQSVASFMPCRSQKRAIHNGAAFKAADVG